MSTSNNYQWWKLKNTKVAEAVFDYMNFLDTDQGYRQQENFKFLRLYGNYDMSNLRAYTFNRVDNMSNVANRVTLNVVQSMIDTVTSKITKNKPKPTFLTEGGDFTQQRKAKKLSQFVLGQFDSMDFYDKAAQAFLDSCIFGTGAIKLFKENNEVKAERVFIDEITVDDRESIYGEPRQMHQSKYIHKDMLKEMFPDDVGAIDMIASEQGETYSSTTQAAPDMILVRESWHLKSGPNATDGKHAITIKSHTLLEEQYDKDYFPFVFWRWGLRQLGFFGQGLAEQLQGLQLEINKILRTIQVSMHLVSVPKLFVEASSKIVDAHLDNRIGSIIKFAGVKPEPGQLGVIPAELFAHLDRLYARAYEIAGVSQLSATSQKPQGLDSGKAIREFNDLETERFMSVAQRYEKTFIKAVPIIIDLIKEIDEDLKEEGGYKVKVKGKKFLQTIKWKEVSLDEDKYSMTCFPTSALSATPAGRLAEVQELIQAGFVGREDAMKLLDFPDLQAFYNFETAPGEDIDMVIEKIVDESEYMTPEPYQDLAYGIQKMQKAYLLFRSQNCPEPKLEMFRRWIEDARALLERAAVDTGRQQLEAEAQMNETAQSQLDASTPPAPIEGIADESVPVNAMQVAAAPL